MLQVREGDGRKLLRTNADTLTSRPGEEGCLAFVHLDDGASELPHGQGLQQCRLARAITSRKKGHPLRLEYELGWLPKTLEILDGDLRDHGVNDSQAEDLA